MVYTFATLDAPDEGVALPIKSPPMAHRKRFLPAAMSLGLVASLSGVIVVVATKNQGVGGGVDTPSGLNSGSCILTTREEWPMEVAFPTTRMPRFFLAGAQKSASTSFTKLIDSHPMVLSAEIKETFFFYDLWPQPKEHDWEWYKDLYPELQAGESHDDGKITGDNSIDYFLDPAAALRVKVAAPNAKILVVLRNPVDRMYSEYQMRLREGKISLSFDEAVKMGTEMWDECYEKINGANSALLDCRQLVFGGPDRTGQLDEASHVWQFIGRSMYYEQALVWLSVFQREQILFIDYITGE
jgi:hypothetical protein